MIGIQLVSHGELCSGIVDSLEMIIGDVAQVALLKLQADTDVDEYQKQMLSQSQDLNRGKGVLIFEDIYGATPYNTALYNSQHFTPAKYQIVAGFNLPLLIEAVLGRENMTLAELVEQLKISANDSIVFQTPKLREETV